MSDYHQDYKTIDDYIKDGNNKFPFVLTGLSGAGKSSLLAYVAKKVKISKIKH